MPLPESAFIAFSLLIIATCTVWLEPIKVGPRITLTPWTGLLVAAMTSGLIARILSPLSIVELGLFCGVAYLAKSSQPHSRQKLFLFTITAILALALALHRLPGFNNPIIISNVTLSAGAATFTQYANFDKGVAGLVLFAVLCRRTASISEWGELLKKIFPVLALTMIAVLGAAALVGYVKPSLKITQVTALFLITNLFFAVIAEEAFFRGFLQDRFASSLSRFRYGGLIAVMCSALIFGLTHIAGGPTYVFLAFLGGLGYAYAYHLTQRIEAPIIVHFALNAAHFIGFTYPHLI
jgi:membrane protease YdiL (CAAX protease family)